MILQRSVSPFHVSLLGEQPSCDAAMRCRGKEGILPSFASFRALSSSDSYLLVGVADEDLCSLARSIASHGMGFS